MASLSSVQWGALWRHHEREILHFQADEADEGRIGLNLDFLIHLDP